MEGIKIEELSKYDVWHNVRNGSFWGGDVTSSYYTVLTLIIVALIVTILSCFLTTKGIESLFKKGQILIFMLAMGFGSILCIGYLSGHTNILIGKDGITKQYQSVLQKETINGTFEIKDSELKPKGKQLLTFEVNGQHRQIMTKSDDVIKKGDKVKITQDKPRIVLKHRKVNESSIYYLKIFYEYRPIIKTSDDRYRVILNDKDREKRL